MDLFAIAPVGLVQLDGEGRIRTVNRRGADLLGRHEDALKGLALRDLIVAEDRAAVDAALAEAATGGQGCDCRSVDGSWINLSASPCEEGLLVALVDVSRRVQSAQRLRASERTLRLFVEYTPAAVAVFDREMRYLAASRRWLQDYHVQDREILGRSHYDVFPEIPERWKEIHRRCLAGAVEGCEEDPFERADGTLDWVRWRIIPWCDEHDAIGGILMFTEVITERKRLEERLRQGEKMEAVGRLVGGIAHDFNNILCAVQGFADLARRRVGDPEVIEDLDGILASARTAADTVGKLLAFSRKQVLRLEVRNFDSAIVEILPMIERMIGERVVTQRSLSSGDARVDIDSSLIPTVLMNLCANARDAMPDGGTLGIATRVRDLAPADIREGERLLPGPHVELTVTDAGIGMSPELLRQVCEPFFSTKGRGHGTGLGLATTRGAIEQHAGALRLSSSTGRGTVATVLLPCCGEVPRPDPVARPRRRDAGGACILLVEDEAMLRQLFRRALGEAGYAVHLAASAEEALTLWAEIADRTDLLVSDVILPGMSGPQLLGRLREDRPDLPVLFISGYDDRQLATQGALEQGTPLLRKPFGVENLLTAIGPALEWVPQGRN